MNWYKAQIMFLDHFTLDELTFHLVISLIESKNLMVLPMFRYVALGNFCQSSWPDKNVGEENNGTERYHSKKEIEMK